MTTYGLDTPLKSPPAPLWERGEKTSPPRAKGSSLLQREDRRDLTAPGTPTTPGITP